MRPEVVVGKVIDVRPHPERDFVRLARVDIGPVFGKVQIVFGGPDLVVAGDFVPVALPGARLPDRKKMRVTKFRGETSHGMFCSAAELGWEPGGPDEVAILRPSDLEPGDVLHKSDWPRIKAEETADHLKAREHWQQYRYGAKPAAEGSTPDGLRETVQAPAVG